MVLREEIPKRRESEHASVPLLFGAGGHPRFAFGELDELLRNLGGATTRVSLCAPRAVQKNEQTEDEILEGGILFVCEK